MKPRWLVLPFAVVLTATAVAQRPAPSDAAPEPAADPVAVHTSVTKTAVWVGDPIMYVVELRCGPKVDILTDDLEAERLALEGLELLRFDSERDASVPERVTYRMRYELVAYDPEATALKVGAIPVRYHVREPGIRPEDIVPAGEVQVPPIALSLRSTIPEGMAAELRDDRGVQALPRWIRLARPIGLGLVVLAIAPVAVWGADLVRRARRSRSAGRPRRSRKQLLSELDEIKAATASSPAALREAYARLDAWVRANLQQTTGVAAVALTPAEIGAAVAHPPRTLRMDQVQNVLSACERAKYAPDDPSEDQWRTVLLEAEHAVGADRR